MAEAVEASGGAAAPPKKKSLFSKSTWAKPAVQKEGIEFFSRADELWPSRLAEEERKRQKKSIRTERKRSTASAEVKPPSTPDSKRQRLSQNDDERHSLQRLSNHKEREGTSWTPREATLSPSTSRKSNSSYRQKSQASPVSLTERYSRDLHTRSNELSKNENVASGYISLSDSDNEAALETIYDGKRAFDLEDDDGDVFAVISKSAPLIEEHPTMSDEEFPELARHARARAKQKELERLKSAQPYKDKNYEAIGSQTTINLQDDIFEERSVVAEDPIVEIFVSSVIENTIPLRVQRKLSQNIQKVKLAWCDRQNMSSQPVQVINQDNIFFTWKGIKLFDLTTCKSLGLKIDSTGQVKSDGEGFAEGKIHFEAWTQELYDSNQRRLKAKQNVASEDETEVVEQPVEGKMKLYLQAKDQKPLRVTVKPTTTFSKMVMVFKNSREIPEGQEITLYFDGDKLDPESMVKDTELDDRDTVEVHMR